MHTDGSLENGDLLYQAFQFNGTNASTTYTKYKIINHIFLYYM